MTAPEPTPSEGGLREMCETCRVKHGVGHRCDDIETCLHTYGCWPDTKPAIAHALALAHPAPEPQHDAAVAARADGRCGDRAQPLLPSGQVALCCLPAGHAGWHRGDDGSEWSPEPPLSEGEKQLLADQVLGGATPSTLMVRAVERILADRAEALRGEVERLEHGSRCPQCCATEWNEASRQRARAEAAEAKIARVEALLDEWALCLRDPRRRPGWSGGAVLADVRAALEDRDV